MAAAAKKVVALIDSVRWVDEETGAIVEHVGKGQAFDLPAGEFDRLHAAGAVEASSSSRKKPDAFDLPADE